MDEYTVSIDYDSERETDGLINDISKEHISFKIREKQLLPDSLNLKYFSVNERKFYLLRTVLPYEKIKNLFRNHKKEVTVLSLEILPKGKIILKINTTEKDNLKSQIIEAYIAKETIGNLNQLIYLKSLEKTYNGYEGIENITDFSNLLQNQYKLLLKLEVENNDELKEIQIMTYANENMDLSEKISKFSGIPKNFYMKWGKRQEYGIQYYFNANEILKAFQILNKLNPDQPINILFKLYNEKNPQCEISKNGKTIPLKDLYPELPTKYVR